MTPLLNVLINLIFLREVFMPAKLTQEQFIERSKQVHGDYYDYDLVEYVGGHNKVSICCKIHGVFSQTPSSHMSGRGCNKCGRVVCAKKTSMSKEDFINKSVEIHGNRYDYSLVDFKNTATKVVIICKEHGAFEQTPDSHLYQKAGCIKCGNESASLLRTCEFKDFVNKAVGIHEDKFDYTKAELEYKNLRSLITLYCPLHESEFKISACKHLQGSHCQKCGKIEGGLKQRIPAAKSFVAKAIKKHGNKYNYSKVDYQLSNKKVEIICSKHGSFFTRPNRHLMGDGCPICNTGGYTSSESGYLYILKYENITKVGITNSEPSGRAYFINKDSGKFFKVWYKWYFDDGAMPIRIESSMLRILRESFSNPEEKFNGSSECFCNLDPTYLKELIEMKISELNVQYSTNTTLITA
jgi:hypothetical protein